MNVSGPSTDAAVAPGQGRCVGVIDSGVGGLAVTAVLRDQLPAATWHCFADSACAPYGSRSTAWIRNRVLQSAELLLDAGADALVIACNTATSAAADWLRARLNVPIVAMEPAVKPALAEADAAEVAVLVTPHTAQGTRLARLIAAHDAGGRVHVLACPGLVEAIESGADSTQIAQLVEVLTVPVRDCRRVVLGCTHFPLVIPELRGCFCPDAALIDPAPAVARQLALRLQEVAPSHSTASAGLHCWTSGTRAALERQLDRWPLGLAPQSIRAQVLPTDPLPGRFSAVP
ncbi:MAG: glutamate racemase [Pseudomonadota bacterium]|nr:glutamate racemase [Pseudomonadota bacterium]